MKKRLSTAIRKWPMAISTPPMTTDLALAEHAVGEDAAEERRQVHEGRVQAVDLRREGWTDRVHASEVPEEPTVERGLQHAEAEDVRCPGRRR